MIQYNSDESAKEHKSKTTISFYTLQETD